jgi:integrase
MRCRLADGDIPKRRPHGTVLLPRPEQMTAIYEATLEWASSQRFDCSAMRTAAITIFCFETGTRGVEAREATLDNQNFDRTGGIGGLLNPLNIESAKLGPTRQVTVEPQGWEMLLYWLTHWRPGAESLWGPMFPSGSGRELASSSLSETSGRLLAYLKDRGLLHDSFTFHATRKTYATHFVGRNGFDIDRLLNQCGWITTSQLKTYLCPSQQAIDKNRRAFAAAVGQRSGL